MRVKLKSLDKIKKQYGIKKKSGSGFMPYDSSDICIVSEMYYLFDNYINLEHTKCFGEDDVNIYTDGYWNFHKNWIENSHCQEVDDLIQEIIECL